MSKIVTTLVGPRMQNVIGDVIQEKVGEKMHNFLVIKVDLDDRCKLPDGTVRVTAPSKEGRGGGNESVATSGGTAFLPALPAFGVSLNVWKKP